MGCIDLATLTFKEGYNLKELEIMIRAPLYEAGLDYGHGSTHGIGSYLAVHEGIISFFFICAQIFTKIAKHIQCLTLLLL